MESSLHESNNEVKESDSTSECLNGDIDLELKIKELEEANKQIQEDFDSQRAKMKELFLQKEEEEKQLKEENEKLKAENLQLQHELNDAKSQLVVLELRLQNTLSVERRKAEDEIASFQQIIDSTMEENATHIAELESKVSKLVEENNNLRMQLFEHNTTEGNPISLSTMTKSFAKKVASHIGADSLSNTTESDENTLKSRRHADEDAEVLRSLVVPLEDEITALKEKLRTTDTELQKYKTDNQGKSKLKEFPGSSDIKCEMCSNYEAQLQRIQMEVKDLSKKLHESDQLMQTQKQDLIKEVEFRKGMEDKWNEKKEEHKAEVLHLTASVKTAKQIIDELRQQYIHTKDTIAKELNRLTRDRDEVQRHLDELQTRNDYLLGKYSKNSEHYQFESINMPNTVEELHVCILKIREELIVATIAKEEAQKLAGSLECELSLLHEQIDRVNQEKEQREIEIQSLIEKIKKLEMQIAELRQQITNLQQELNTGEQTQKDFVLLTQSLQVQLQKIRDSEKEVRWQYEEDVNDCPTCHISFSSKKKEKVHCRHCGQIFCQSCLQNIVQSGPNKRPTRVCNVCHTLLVEESAPYFSRDPP